MKRFWWSGLAVLFCLALALPVSAKSHPVRKDPYARFLSVNSRTKTAQVTLVAALNGADGGFNFDGAYSGRAVLRVPIGWTVVVHFLNRGPLPHSAAFVVGKGPRLAFPGASSPDPTSGTPAGKRAVFRFRTTRLGTYRIACLVPGHEDAGMWIAFVVTKPNVRPSFTGR